MMAISVIVGGGGWLCPTGPSSQGSLFADAAETRPLSYYEHVSATSRTATHDHQRRSFLEEEDVLASPTPSEKSKNNIYIRQFVEARLYFSDRGQPETASEALQRRFRYIFGPAYKRKNQRKGRWIKPAPWHPSARRLENNYYDDDKQKYYGDDDAYKNNDDGGNTDDGSSSSNNDDFVSVADERCSEFLVSFLEGTTDAHDTCEGMMNAYTAAGTR